MLRYKLRTLLIVVAVAGLLLAYWRSYIVSSRVGFTPGGEPGTPGVMIRLYRKPWQVVVFRPAAKLESIVTGRRVLTATKASDD